MGNIFTSCEICKSCRFYQQLYTKDKKRFKKVLGWCTNKPRCARNIRTLSLYITQCEFWEKREDKKLEQEESVRQVISDIRLKLTQILEVLENNE